MHVIVLGSAAGGGVPQWNCRCDVCRLAWAGDPRVRPRTQSSLAVSATGEQWLLVNASPDIRQQIAATPELQPRRGRRDSPIGAVLLTNGDVDHVAGLLGLRERQHLALHGTEETLGVLAQNSIFQVLAADLVTRQPMAMGEPVEILPGLTVELFAVPGKVPLWLEGDNPTIGSESGSTVGARINTGTRTLAYVPGCAAASEGLISRIAGVDLLLFDGTLWKDDEMIEAGLGTKSGQRMGHMSMSGPDGSMAALAGVEAGRRVFVHINNTNPALVEGSAERRAVEAEGWSVAHDGLAFKL